MPERSEPLHLVGAVTPDFRRVFAQLREELGFTGELDVRNLAPLRLEISDAGIAIRADENSDVVVTLPWASLGKVEEHSLPFQGVSLRSWIAFVGSVIVAIITLGLILELPDNPRERRPVLHLPVAVGDNSVDLDVSVNSTWGVAREVEQRRPRPAYGKAAPWV